MYVCPFKFTMVLFLLLGILYPYLLLDGASMGLLSCSSLLSLSSTPFLLPVPLPPLLSPPLLFFGFAFRPVTLRLTCFFFDFSSLPFCGQPGHTVRLATSRYSMFYLILLSYPSLLPFSAPLLLPLFPFYPTSSLPRLFPASKGVCPKRLCPTWQHLTNL